MFRSAPGNAEDAEVGVEAVDAEEIEARVEGGGGGGDAGEVACVEEYGDDEEEEEEDDARP